jgi:hypothetical protein
MNNRQFAILISITFLVGMVWLISDIIFNTKASIPVSPKLQTLLESVNPNFNARVIKIINDEVGEKSPPVSIQSVSTDTSGTSTSSGQTTP